MKILRIILILASIPIGVIAQQENPANPDWNKLHSTEEAYALLKGWQQTNPGLTELYSIGNTLKGTELLVLEITNKETGPGSSKPGYYYDGNIHAGELTGAEVALHFAWHLLSNYGKDPRITALLDTRVLYIRPKFNPDGADIALKTSDVLRSTPRPYDQDQDGLIDEDPSTDLNGDGVITQMRVPNSSGIWKISTEDPRLMIRKTESDFGGKYFDIYSEGIDDDEDGFFNEDGTGGIDMNRNFPRNWGLESEQTGAGPYPLSEPETRATIEFLTSHRNVTGVFHGHTSGGFLFRLPSTTAWDNFNILDQRLILELSDKYNTTTDQRVIPSYSNPRVHRHGTLISWSYWDFGVVAFVPEFWGAGEDYDGNGRVSDVERLQWNDKELNGKGFINWKSYKHLQLGNIEIGGWNRKFVLQNPPSKFIKSEIEQYVPWMTWLAEISPEINIKDINTEFFENNKFCKVTLTIENIGYLATNISQRAIDLEIAKPVWIDAESSGATIISGKNRQAIGHLAGTRDQDGPGDSSRKLEWVIQIDGANPILTINVQSEKGGTKTKAISLKQ